MIDISLNHFELFGLPPQFRIDFAALDRAYRELQSEVHPDRFANGSDTEKRIALQASARVNAGYRVLKDPVERANALLQLHGISALTETDTALPVEFLERQLARREAASEAIEAGDERGLSTLIAEAESEAHDLEDAIAAMLDHDRKFAEARTRVRELKFLQKLAEDLRGMQLALDEH